MFEGFYSVDLFFIRANFSEDDLCVSLSSLGFGPFHCEKNNNYEVMYKCRAKGQIIFVFVRYLCEIIRYGWTMDLLKFTHVNDKI